MALGFDWRASVAGIQAQPSKTDDLTIRPLTTNDLDSVKAPSLNAYICSRASDTTQLLTAQFPGFLREREERADVCTT